VHPPPSSARANFTLITECTPESSGCNSVYSVVSANEYSCAHHVTWSPNKLWRSIPPYLTYGYKCLISGLWSRTVRVSGLRVAAAGLQRSRAEYAAVRRAAQHRRTHGRPHVHRRCALPSRLHSTQYPGNAPPPEKKYMYHRAPTPLPPSSSTCSLDR
jgi:hypothetical protein